MSSTAIEAPSAPNLSSAGDELVALGWEVNANQYRLVHLAAQVDEELDWFRLGHTSASAWIASRLQIQTSTAREWIRVGHALRHLPLTDAAFGAQEISYAKVRVLSRWADEGNEAQLLDLARERTAGRLTVAIAKFLADDGESDTERELRLHDERSLTTWTDADGMTVVRIALPPSVAKPVVAAVDELVRRIAATPPDEEADATPAHSGSGTDANAADAPADASGEPSVGEPPLSVASARGCSTEAMPATLRDLRRRWQPATDDEWVFPSLAQQRADAFVVLFLGCDVSLTTEVVVHVRGDGITFDDGTPTTGHSVVRQLADSFVRLLIHDAEGRPINASSRRRHPTTRQARVVMETHRHECIDCQSTDLLELDHNPSFEQTARTVTHELEPRCAPCHRARHRHDQSRTQLRAA